MDGLWTEACGQQKQSNDPWQQPAHPQYANYWAPLTRKRHTMPHSAQPQHTNYWAPRTRKRHQQEHRPQRPTESSNPTQPVKGRADDCPGPVKEQQPDGMSHRGVRTFFQVSGVPKMQFGWPHGDGNGKVIPTTPSQRTLLQLQRGGICPNSNPAFGESNAALHTGLPLTVRKQSAAAVQQKCRTGKPRAFGGSAYARRPRPLCLRPIHV